VGVGFHQRLVARFYGVFVARPQRRKPRDFSAGWPDDACTDPTAEVARQLAVRLRTELGGRSLRAAREITGVDHTTVAAVLNGTTWPDLVTIARLEAGLDVDLWPGRLT